LNAQSAVFVADALNLGGKLRSAAARAGSNFFAATYPESAPLQGRRMFEDDRWLLLFAGDLVRETSVPYGLVLTALETGKFASLASLEGIFGIVAYDKLNEGLYAITDRRSQKPLFYFADSDGVCVGTHLAVFTRLSKNLGLDKTWFWQNLFFNMPADEATFLVKVKRLPPASILSHDCRTRRTSLTSYSDRFQPRAPLLRGQEALRYAKEIFAARTPAYYEGSEEIACALTSGWDGRTMLALAPADKKVSTYTYGCPGCTDLVDAATTARWVSVDHYPIPFDDAFIANLAMHSLETVFLSSGLETVLRATLHYAYQTLTQNGSRYPLTISGIALDIIFRGHAQTPSLISHELAQRFKGRDEAIDAVYWRSILGKDYGAFAALIRSSEERLICEFGPFASAAHHLSYFLYVLLPRYFCGELSLAEHYTTVRIPALDSEIVKLAHSIEQSTLIFSQFRMDHKRGSREEMLLQAYLLREFAPRLYALPVRGRPPSAVLAGPLAYEMSRLFHGLKKRLFMRSLRPEEVPLENWSSWLFERGAAFVHDLLLQNDTRVLALVERSFVVRMIAARNTRFVGKLLTTEIVMRLIENKWQRFW
jgi:asparagine synthetase B (glutamine-hydrolysing)